MTHAQIAKDRSPYRFPSMIPRNYGSRKSGWKLTEAPAAHDMCISWDSRHHLTQWEVSRMNERRADEESLNQSIQISLMEGHGGSAGGYGVPGLGNIITEEDMANRTWCKACTDECNSGRCASGPECTALPGATHTSIWYHHHRQRESGAYDNDSGLVPVCTKCQRDYLLEHLDDLMTNPLIRALSDVITAQSAMTLDAVRAMNRSIASTAATVVASPVATVTAVIE